MDEAIKEGADERAEEGRNNPGRGDFEEMHDFDALRAMAA